MRATVMVIMTLNLNLTMSSSTNYMMRSAQQQKRLAAKERNTIIRPTNTVIEKHRSARKQNKSHRLCADYAERGHASSIIAVRIRRQTPKALARGDDRSVGYTLKEAHENMTDQLSDCRSI